MFKSPEPIEEELKVEENIELMEVDTIIEETIIVEEAKVEAGTSQEKREGNCYCGKDRNLNIAELLCAYCSRWFHESCIGYQLGKLVPFLTNYSFICKNCSTTGLESFKKSQASFQQICVTAIANLMQIKIKEGCPKLMFSKDKEIIPFIDAHWEGMTTMGRRVKNSWHGTVHRTLQKDLNSLFICEEVSADGTSSDDHPLFGLISPELTQIKPNYEALSRSGNLPHVGPGAPKSRGAKRKVEAPGSGPGKKRGGDLSIVKLPSHGYPLEHPFNKDGYRYVLAEPDPYAPFRQEFDESNDWAGKPIPGWLYRTLSPASVLLALHDRAPQLRVSEDRLSITGEKGYCSIRATHGVARGTWYWEATIEEMQEGAATRIGWAQEYANLQAPCGYDKFGYSWRSRKGTVFHESRGRHYSSGFGAGDVLGILIVLPDTPSVSYVPATYKDRPLVKFKSHLYYEDKDKVQEYLKKMTPINGSKILFFKNGELQGEAFTDLNSGIYFPCISVFKPIAISVNFGPDFKFPPKDIAFRGMNEKAEEAIVEQTMSDLLYLTENQGKLRLEQL